MTATRYRVSYRSGVIEDDGSPRSPHDSEPMVLAVDYDSLLKERDALQGKLKVAVDKFESIACCANGSTGMPGSNNYNPQKLVNECIDTANEALAQIGDL